MLSAYQGGIVSVKPLVPHVTANKGGNRNSLTCVSVLHHSTDELLLGVTRYDEEQAQSENAERDLRSRSGQSLGSKGSKGSAGIRPAAATWK